MPERERERERESDGTGILFEEPNPTGSRPSDLIGLYRKWQREKRPLFERETEHLRIRPPNHGIGGGPR